jgi:hypothetical protein
MTFLPDRTYTQPAVACVRGALKLAASTHLADLSLAK